MSIVHFQNHGRSSDLAYKLVLLSALVLFTTISCVFIEDPNLLVEPMPHTPIHVFAAWASPYQLIAIGICICTLATTMYRFVFVEQSRNQFHLICSHLIANILGAFAYWCVYMQNFAYIDPYGLAIAPPIYVMWCFTSGSLTYLMLADQDVECMSTQDRCVVIGLHVCLLCGSLAARTRYFELLMYICWACFGLSLFGIFLSAAERDTSNIRGKRKVRNLYICGIIIAAFPTATVFVLLDMINNDHLLVVLTILDATAKCTLTILNLDCQLAHLLSVESELVFELAGNKRRREFMKYMFHEVRTPLNTIAMGLDYLSAVDESGLHANLTFQTVLKSIAELETKLDSFTLIQQMEDNTFVLSLSSANISSVISEVTEDFLKLNSGCQKVNVGYNPAVLNSTAHPSYLIDISNIQFILMKMLLNASILCGDLRDVITVEISSDKKPIHSAQEGRNAKHRISVTVQSMTGEEIADVIDNFFSEQLVLSTSHYHSVINFVCLKIAERHGGYMSCELSPDKRYVIQTLVFTCALFSLNSSPALAVSKEYDSGSYRSETAYSEYSPNSDAKRFITNRNNSSPVVEHIKAKSECSIFQNVLSNGDIQILGTTGSLYRTKMALIALCRHNEIVFSSNNTKVDIVEKLRSAGKRLLHLPTSSSEVAIKNISHNPLGLADFAVSFQGSNSEVGHDECDDYSHLTVLVVDDSEMNRKLLQRMLKLFNVHTDVAENGLLAVEMVASRGRNHYDIIFMDYTMPIMDGVEATSIIRQKLRSSCKIIAVTGNAMADDVKAFHNAGADRVILKPIRQAVLKEELASMN